MVDVVLLSAFSDIVAAAFILFSVVIPLIVLWTLALVVFVPVFGLLVYLFARRPDTGIAAYEEITSSAFPDDWVRDRR